ncbi:terminase small subunit [Jeotgalibaca porci]|uniref:terminase small subunit n=1 Tax=Jeotgalibaca porci TaxID=1868793 RepID=UPI0035A0F402
MNWEEIRKEYETSDITMKDLAEKHGVKPSTLRSRKNREKWSDDKRNATNNVATRNATQHKNVATRKAVKELQENDELTEKQKAFCLYFTQTLNATKSYQRAYDVGYNTASTNGSKLLANAKVKAEITRIKDARKKDWLVDEHDIMQEHMRMAFSDYSDYIEFGMREVEKKNEYGEIEYDDDGNAIKELRPFVQLKDKVDVDGRIIKKLVYGRNGVEVELYDKQKALTDLERFITDKGTGGTAITIVDTWSDDDG